MARTHYEIIPCYGRSQKSGKKVGARHRWTNGYQCDWCQRFKDSVYINVKPEKNAIPGRKTSVNK